MTVLSLQASLFCLIAKLQGDKKAFQRAQQAAADDNGQGHKDHEMNPIGRFVSELCPERSAKNQKPANQADEDGWPVARIREREVEPAAIAFVAKIDEMREDLAASAVGTAPEETCAKRRYWRIIFVQIHFLREIKKGAAFGHPFDTGPVY
jgi:hypothetical protein